MTVVSELADDCRWLFVELALALALLLPVDCEPDIEAVDSATELEDTWDTP